VRQTVAPASRTGEVTVLAIDNSLSMRAGNRLDQAKQMARRMVAGLRPAQRAQVLAFGARVQAMSEVTDDHAPLNAGIDAIEASDARTSFAELARSLRSIAQSIHLPLAVHLYSDMQQSGMPANFNDLRLNAAVRLEPHPLATKEAPTSRWRTWWRRGACTTAASRACWPPSRVSATPRPRAAFRSS
jgi:hypothetical protein